MAFQNELIPEAAKQSFDFSIFKRHGGPIDVSSPFETWTIDHERNAFLICTSFGAGPDGQGSSIFNLWWNGEVANVQALLQTHNDAQGRLIVKWNYVDVYLAPPLESRRQEWTNAAREALLAFGVGGGIPKPGLKHPNQQIVTVVFSAENSNLPGK